MLQNSFAQHDKTYHRKECSDQTAFISMTTPQDFINVKMYSIIYSTTGKYCSVASINKIDLKMFTFYQRSID